MTCFRCHSLMVPESSLHHHNTDYSLDLSDVQTIQSTSYHCICCGNYEDAVVLANRAKQVQEMTLIQSLAKFHSAQAA